MQCPHCTASGWPSLGRQHSIQSRAESKSASHSITASIAQRSSRPKLTGVRSRLTFCLEGARTGMDKLPVECWRLIAIQCAPPDVLALASTNQAMLRALTAPMLPSVAEARWQSRNNRLVCFWQRIESRPAFLSRLQINTVSFGDPTPHPLTQDASRLCSLLGWSPASRGHSFFGKRSCARLDHLPLCIDFRTLQLMIGGRDQNDPFYPVVWRTFWPRSPDQKTWTSDFDQDPRQRPDLIRRAAQWLCDPDVPPSFDQAVEMIDAFARNLFRC